MPAQVIVGLCAGISAITFLCIELDNSNKYLQWMSKSRTRILATTTIMSFAFGFVVGPVAGVVVDVMILPAMAIKCWFVRRYARKHNLNTPTQQPVAA